MSALQLRQEFNAFVARAWGFARFNALAYLKNNLPTSSGTLGNYTDFPAGKSLAGLNLYAKGDLRDSYYEVTVVPGSATGRTGRISSFVTNSPYAFYYANGRLNSDTYHGFDFIAQTKKDLEEAISGAINIEVKGIT